MWLSLLRHPGLLKRDPVGSSATGFVLNMTGLVINTTWFVLHTTGIVKDLLWTCLQDIHSPRHGLGGSTCKQDQGDQCRSLGFWFWFRRHFYVW